MNHLKNYFHPQKQQPNEKQPQHSPAAINPGNQRPIRHTIAQSSPRQYNDFPLPPPSPASLGISGQGTPSRSQQTSRPGSMFQQRSFDVDDEAILQLKHDMMVEFLWQQQRKETWTLDRPGEGVLLKKSRGQYACAPKSLAETQGGIFDAVRDMNVKVAMTVSTPLMKMICSQERGGSIVLGDGLRLQVLRTVQDLPQCQKHQFAAFVANTGMLVVWDDDPYHVITRAAALEEQLLRMNWGHGMIDDEKAGEGAGVNVFEVPSEDGDDNIESAASANRPTRILAPIMMSFTITILIGALGLGWRQLANEYKVDGRFGLGRLGLLALTPLQCFLSLFFMGVIVSSIFQMIGPISQVKTNSKCYSAVRPRRLRRGVEALPHVTIQCPVYKEGLASVIQPTILSVKAAISTYEMQGGSGNIFINDDGMQLISEEDAQMRRDFYDEHSIGWVARPKHNPNPADGEKAFLRRGKFKKASNMNYALMISNRVEEKLLLVERDDAWNDQREKQSYRECLATVLREEEGRAWADGNVRIGDYILLIDSDTRVPKDCLLDATSEMELSPEVGILQYSSGVMQVANDFFENGITFFTNLVYNAIQYSCANGDVVPFVGHNAVLRWAALQEVVYTDEDGYEKFWSESHVSEDFDMALRLQCLGFSIRFGAYTGEGFKEGVSLTVYDELARWEKYAYGCNELLFHPIRYWIFRGPFTPLFRRFITSNMRMTSKLTILSYIGTYYAIGAAWLLTLGNFFIIGFMQGSPYLSKYYLDSFKIWFSLICVFNALGNVSLAVYRYRIGQCNVLTGLITNFKWLPLLTVFLGGISLHVSQALLSHMFSIDMTWGATAKEVDTTTTFFKEWRKLFRKFRGTFIFCLAVIALMVAFAHFVPPLWRISESNAIIPLIVLICTHFLMPVALNPGLMMLKW